jgi:membrane protein DedA with SNARE-associated domain
VAVPSRCRRGCAVLATIYTTIGFAVLEAWFGDHPWPWLVGAVVAIVVVVAATWLVRRRRAARVAAAS